MLYLVPSLDAGHRHADSAAAHTTAPPRRPTAPSRWTSAAAPAWARWPDAAAWARWPDAAARTGRPNTAARPGWPDATARPGWTDAAARGSAAETRRQAGCGETEAGPQAPGVAGARPAPRPHTSSRMDHHRWRV